jgi:Asp-tRNA(Asn)/Glu-tRNA(Gln) amidotransferase A subunit family amidase
MLGEDVLYLSAGELGEQIRAGKISPVELTESYLARSERLGPQLAAYVTITRELALEQARQAEKEIRAGHLRGPLHGIPYAAKDLLAVKGYPTTWGARPYATQRFDFNATVIERLERAGAVLIGKAAMIELAGGMDYRYASASLTGAAKNPWNETCWTCGSSSGSGAIAAAALAGFAIGTETWGSIICPSGFCGASGLRPTYGRVSRHGAMALAYSMDKIGPLGRSAQDCALVLAAIAGHDPLDPASLPPTEAAFHAGAPAARLGGRPLRVGWLAKGWKKVEPGIASAVRQALKTLEASGARVEEAALPEGPWEDAAGVIISAEGASAFHSLIASGRVAELADPLGQIGGYVNEQVAASDYLRAQRVRLVLAHAMDRLFDRFDVLAAASLPVTATPLSTNLETDLSFPDPIGGIGNLCGLPATSVPCGFVNGLPAGIQFLGRVADEAAVLAAAELFQQHTDWNRRRPPLP